MRSRKARSHPPQSSEGSHETELLASAVDRFLGPPQNPDPPIELVRAAGLEPGHASQERLNLIQWNAVVALVGRYGERYRTASALLDTIDREVTEAQSRLREARELQRAVDVAVPVVEREMQAHGEDTLLKDSLGWPLGPDGADATESGWLWKPGAIEAARRRVYSLYQVIDGQLEEVSLDPSPFHAEASWKEALDGLFDFYFAGGGWGRRDELLLWRRDIIAAVLDELQLQGFVRPYRERREVSKRLLTAEDARIVQAVYRVRESVDAGELLPAAIASRTAILSTVADSMGIEDWKSLIPALQSVGAYRVQEGRGRRRKEDMALELEHFWTVIEALYRQLEHEGVVKHG